MEPNHLTEEVLVVPATLFADVGEFHGFQSYSEPYGQALLDPAYVSFRPRAAVETDPSYKQLIPYALLRCGGEVFHYTRGGSGTETRLRSRRSVGVGGHICRADGATTSDPYRAGLLRELNEEVEIQSVYRETLLGFFYDGRTPVGQVHIGIVHLLELEEPLVWPREAAIVDSGFAPLRELLRCRDEFETWSQFALEYLAENCG
jgi:predicted NUDIX family phosphoesterase